MPFWQILIKHGQVRPQYYRFTPEDIREIDCKQSLADIAELYYVVHSSQPQNDEEWAYIEMMRRCCMKRVWELK